MDVKKTISKFNELYYGYDCHIFSDLGNLHYVKNSQNNRGYRVNLVIPNLYSGKYFGGVATAIRFSRSLAENLNARFRIISEETFNLKGLSQFEDYSVCFADEENDDLLSVCRYRDLKYRNVIIENNDIFVFTYWTTVYNYSLLHNTMMDFYGFSHNSIYLIQDFEPSFFKWSAYYLLAESTYKIPNTIAVFNTHGLMKYVNRLGYNNFVKQYYFEPKMNSQMREFLRKSDWNSDRTNTVLVYGRPRNARNCFPLIVDALKQVTDRYPKAAEWKYISIGVKHKDYKLNNGCKLESKGKLSIDDYCEILSQSKIGVSLMCSPHPSYPPLEMASFGMHTITNDFEEKDIKDFSENLVILDYVTIDRLADEIIKVMDSNSILTPKIGTKMERFLSMQNDEFEGIMHPLIHDLQERVE